MVHIVIKSEKCTPLTQSMYGWSSYGGSNQGLVDDKIDEPWACQTCGRFQDYEVPPFYFEFSPREYIKICEICHIKRIDNDIVSLNELIDLVRSNHGEINL